MRKIFLNSIVVLLLLFMVSNLQAGTVTYEDRLDYYDINFREQFRATRPYTYI